MADFEHFIGIFSDQPDGQSEAQILAKKLQLPFTKNAELLLQKAEGRWQLLGQYQEAPKSALLVDFVAGKNAWRKKNPGAGKQPIAQAIGIKHSQRPTILDCTAGLGRDAFILASLGCKVWLTERNQVVQTLLTDGLKRAQNDPQTQRLFSESMLFVGNNLDEARHYLNEAPDVIYMDPMFPHPTHKKSAQVKKDMQLLRHLLVADSDSQQWLKKARNWAKKVVVKRPDWANPIANDFIGSTISKGHRYDIYCSTET